MWHLGWHSGATLATCCHSQNMSHNCLLGSIPSTSWGDGNYIVCPYSTSAKTYSIFHDRDHNTLAWHDQDSTVYFINDQESRTKFVEFLNRDRSSSQGFCFIKSRTSRVLSTHELSRTVFSTVSTMRPSLIDSYPTHAIRSRHFCVRRLTDMSSKAYHLWFSVFSCFNKTSPSLYFCKNNFSLCSEPFSLKISQTAIFVLQSSCNCFIHLLRLAFRHLVLIIHAVWLRHSLLRHHFLRLQSVSPQISFRILVHSFE